MNKFNPTFDQKSVVKFNRLGLVLALTGALTMAPFPAVADGSLPDDNPFDCTNNNLAPVCEPKPLPAACNVCPKPAGCDDESCPAGGGSGGGSGGGPGGGGSCLAAPCNSAMRTSSYGSPSQAFYRRPYNEGSYKLPAQSGESNNGKRSVHLVRQDVHLLGNGGVPLEVVRMYQNNLWIYAACETGQTVFGRHWHFGYDMHIGGGNNPTSDKFFRRADGGQTVLYYRGTPDEWSSNPAQGEAITLVKLSGSAGYRMYTADPALWYNFNLDGKVTSIRFPNGNLVVFTRNSSTNRLNRVDFGHETSDIDNRALEFDYTTVMVSGNPRERLWRVRHMPIDEVSVEYAYNSDGDLYQVKNRFGEIIEQYAWGTFSGRSLITEIKARDGDGNLRTTRKYKYDWDTNVTELADGAGTAFLVNIQWGAFYDGYTFTWDGKGMTYRLNHSRNFYEAQTWGPNGLHSRQFQDWTPDTTWLNQSEQVKMTYTDTGSTVTYEYLSENSNNHTVDRQLLKKATNHHGEITEYDYDTNRRLIAVHRPHGRTDSTTYDAQGNVSSQTDWLGDTTYMFYDTWGNLVKTDSPTSLTMEYAYTAHGQIEITTNTEGRATVNQYDSRGRVIATTALGVTTMFDYDDRDRLTTTTDALNNKVVYGYDLKDRTTTVTNQLGHTTTYDYNTTGLLAAVTDGEGGVIRYEYNHLDQLTTLTDQRSKVAAVYEYDWLGRKVAETNPLGNIRRWIYQDDGPSCGSCSGAHQGALVATIAYDGSVTSYTYNAKHQISRIDFAGTGEYVERTYDTKDRLIEELDTRLDAVSADLGGNTFEFDYDAADRLTSVTYPGGGVVAYTFDQLGRRKTLIDPDGNVTTYTYNNFSYNQRIGSISHSLLGQADFEYDSNGMLNRELLPNGILTLWDYDALNRIENSRVYDDDHKDVPLIIEEHNIYNPASIRERVNYNRDPMFGTNYYKLYTYDRALHLTSQNRHRTSDHLREWGYHYTYDLAGNRTEMQEYNGSTTVTLEYTYNDFNQLTYGGDIGDPIGYTYDLNGNMIVANDPLWNSSEYLHDRDNRLVQYSLNSTPRVFYYYDSSGRLLLRTGPDGTKTRYYYDGINQLMTREKPVSGVWRTKKVNALKEEDIGQILAHREYTAWSGSTPTAYDDRWYHYDMLGNTTALTDGAGAAAAQYDMEAFGTVKSGGQNGVHLTTKEWDMDSSLYYFSARWVNSSIGQFLQSAPFGISIEHPYSFAGNSPLVYIDPTGNLLVECEPQAPKPPTPDPPCPIDPKEVERMGLAAGKHCKESSDNRKRCCESHCLPHYRSNKNCLNACMEACSR